NLAFGMMVSAHVSGFVYYCSPLQQEWEFGKRLLFTMLVLTTIGFFIYSPLRAAIQDHWLLPLRINERVVVVQKRASASEVKRGDWVAYMASGYYFSNHYGNGVSSDHHLGLAPVLALAGDQVQFSTNSFIVNGCSQPLLAHMPHSGTVVVPQGDWFIAWLAARIRFYYEQFVLALNLLQRAIEWNAGNFILWLEMGRCQETLGLIGAAQTSFTQAWQLNPECHEACLAAGKLSQRGILARMGGWCRQLWRP
ncbi:MAG TPA: hypothetical protein VMA13_05450, partial [Candidatus Saccharimonadales bacterium]|nr:hypothetical protein [Candidatus Saccharimonadales bacterium]